MQDRLDEVIKVIEKIKKECDTHKYHNRCPYFLKNECRATGSLPFLKEFAKKTPKEPSITLKNIDLSNVSIRKQYLKSGEEESEYHEALHLYLNNEDTKEHVIEELFDFIQAELGILEKRGITAEEVMAEYPKHLQKMESRGNKPREKVQK